jgi:hypothetical protein
MPFHAYDNYRIVSLYKDRMRPIIQGGADDTGETIKIIHYCWQEYATNRPTASDIVRFLGTALQKFPRDGPFKALKGIASVNVMRHEDKPTGEIETGLSVAKQIRTIMSAILPPLSTIGFPASMGDGNSSKLRADNLEDLYNIWQKERSCIRKNPLDIDGLRPIWIAQLWWWFTD